MIGFFKRKTIVVLEIIVSFVFTLMILSFMTINFNFFQEDKNMKVVLNGFSY